MNDRLPIWWPPSDSIRRRGEALLHQQCWLWGCDIRRPEGNALLAYGFKRQRPPADARGSSAYLLACASDSVVVLWGFGLFYGDPTDGVFLGRYGFAPAPARLRDLARLPWSPAQIAPAAAPARPEAHGDLQTQLVAALRWIAGYESWVLATLGAAYRQHCLAEWPAGPFRIPAERMADEWQILATTLAMSTAS
jgi:hypothetical protein